MCFPVVKILWKSVKIWQLADNKAVPFFQGSKAAKFMCILLCQLFICMWRMFTLLFCVTFIGSTSALSRSETVSSTSVQPSTSETASSTSVRPSVRWLLTYTRTDPLVSCIENRLLCWCFYVIRYYREGTTVIHGFFVKMCEKSPKTNRSDSVQTSDSLACIEMQWLDYMIL